MIAAGSATEDIAPLVSDEEIASLSSEDAVVPGAAVECVSAIVADEDVRPRPSERGLDVRGDDITFTADAVVCDAVEVDPDRFSSTPVRGDVLPAPAAENVRVRPSVEGVVMEAAAQLVSARSAGQEIANRD